MINVQIKDGVVVGSDVLVEVTVAGGFVSLVIPKVDLDAAKTLAAKQAVIAAALQKKVYFPAVVAKPIITLAGTVSVDLSIPLQGL